METIDRIPTSKIQRAGKILQTGARVGVNYLKYYGNKMTRSEAEARQLLDENNAEDIYDGLKNLKGSALKVAQMLSMEKNILPESYIDKFSLSQFSVPPLSPPLVIKTFTKYFGKTPTQLYDKFNPQAINAASIGQVHQAEKDGKKLAVKIQYPGVSDSISSDLAMVKPIAIRMFNLKGKGSDQYFKEVEEKLLDETNYILEVEQSLQLASSCAHIEGLRFPGYYPELSSERIITMDWMDGRYMTDFCNENLDPEIANRIGQYLWNFYMYQIHELRKFHADPHPGNFLISDDNELIVLDFGCTKEIPDDFYAPYFALVHNTDLDDKEEFQSKLFELEILKPDDSKREQEFFSGMFHRLFSLFTRPFQNEVFNFADPAFLGEIAALGQEYSKNAELRKLNGNRGSRHFIYVNRTFFGLFNLLHDLGATKIEVR